VSTNDPVTAGPARTGAISDLLDGLEAAAKKATPGPWKVENDGGQCSGTGEYWAEYGVACGGKPPFVVGDDEEAEADAACIVAEHNTAPLLVAAIRAVLELADDWDSDGDARYAHNRIARSTAARAVREAVASALGAES